MIFFLYLLILSGFIFTRGFFSLNGIFILAAACILFVITLRRRKLSQQTIISPDILLLILGILSLVMYGGLYQRNFILVILSLMLLVLNLFLVLLFITTNLAQTKRNIFLSMLVIALLLRLFMIWSAPSPYIDVYDYLKNGALGFLHGQNPYSLVYTKFYENVTPDFYSYLPGMLFFTMPFVAVFSDPRYAMVFAELSVAFIIYRLSKNKIKGYLYALLLVNNPISLFMVEQSYTEPIILFLLVIFAYFLIRKRNLSSSISWGVLLATKQYAILIIPLVWRLFMFARAAVLRLTISLFVMATIVLPFFLWNKADFIHDAVFLQSNFPPRYEGLSFFSFLYRFGISYNLILGTVIIGLFLLFVYTRGIKNLSQFFFLASLTFFIFFFFNKWAFVNYYYLVVQLLLVSGILAENKL